MEPWSSVVSYRNSTSNHNDDIAYARSRPVVSYRNSTSNHNSTIPQLAIASVVSYRNSTSNHNLPGFSVEFFELYLIEILHQTTTTRIISIILALLYLIEILHQTTTMASTAAVHERCILSKFYIKPQHHRERKCQDWVVSYRNSTSNHNRFSWALNTGSVVSYRNSTSNHNNPVEYGELTGLYLIEILHQTTTFAMSFRNTWGCILSKFYIKPQPLDNKECRRNVVSYRNSTSNHNLPWR